MEVDSLVELRYIRGYEWSRKIDAALLKIGRGRGEKKRKSGEGDSGRIVSEVGAGIFLVQVGVRRSECWGRRR